MEPHHDDTHLCDGDGRMAGAGAGAGSDTSVSYQAKRGPGQGKHIVFLTRRRGVSKRRGAADAGEDPQPAPRLQVHRPLLCRSGRHDQSEEWKVAIRCRGDRFRRCDRHAAALPCLARRGHGAIREAPVSRQADRRAADEYPRLQRIPEGSPWESWNYNNEGGFGKRVLGETWLTHWGKHKSRRRAARSSRRNARTRCCAASPTLRRHGRLRGLSARGCDDSGSRCRAQRDDGRRGACRLPEARARPTKSSRA